LLGKVSDFATVVKIGNVLQVIQRRHIIVVYGHHGDNALHVFVPGMDRNNPLNHHSQYNIQGYRTHVAFPSLKNTQLIVSSRLAAVIFFETGFRVNVKLC